MGTVAGEKAKRVIDSSTDEELTPTICVAEIYAKVLLVEGLERAELQRAFIKLRSQRLTHTFSSNSIISWLFYREIMVDLTCFIPFFVANSWAKFLIFSASPLTTTVSRQSLLLK